MMKKKNKKVVSFSLYEESFEKLRQLAELNQRSMSNYLDVLIYKDYAYTITLSNNVENPRSIFDDIS